MTSSDSMIRMVTLATGSMMEVWQLVRRTWLPWCDRTGVYLRDSDSLPDSRLAPSWNKIVMLLNSLDCATQPIWWIDSDLLLLDQAFKLPKFDTPIAISTDWNGICCCFMGVNPCPEAAEFLRSVLFLGDVADNDVYGKGLGTKWEQNAIKACMDNFPKVSASVTRLSASLVADQPPFKAPLAHLGGRTNEQRLQIARSLIASRKLT